MATPRGELRAELDRRLLPALARLGFEGPSALAGNALLHEFRRRADPGTQVIRLQFDKHARPRFVLTFYEEPPEGFERLYRDGGTVLQGQLRPRPGGSAAAWFRTDPPWWSRLLRRPWPAAAELAEQCVALVPIIEAWWGAPAPSRHISVIAHRFPGHGR